MSTVATHTRRLALCVAITVVMAGLVRPAAAETWIPFGGDRWIWLDQDSVTISGDVVSFTLAHSAAENVPPGPDARRGRQSVNCRTLTSGDGEESWPADKFIVARYCPKREAAKPALTPAKPAQSTASKALPDFKVCETYSDDSKARIAACTRVIESKNPGFADLVAAHYNRCYLRVLAKEKTDDALADCSRAIALDPKNYDAIVTRGEANGFAGRRDAAIADFTQAIALNPKATRAYSERAQAYVGKKDVKNAVADFTAERNVNPNADEAEYRLILCWVRGHLNAELETALSDCESAIRLKPQRSYGYQKRGIVRLRMGDLKGARADADKTLSLEPKNAWALYARAIVNAREGKTMASYQDYAAATKLSPDYVVKDYEKMGLKLIVQAETAPFCPALTALIKAAAERAASKAKADVAMPGATYCKAFDRGYGCNWQTGAAQVTAKQKALAASAGACLTGYVRTDSNASTGPSSRFEAGKTTVVVGTAATGKAAFDSVAAAVSIAK